MGQKISVLFVPFGTARVAATRYRIYQYLPYLRAEKIEFKVFSIIGDATTRQMIQSPTFGKSRKIIYYFQLVLEKLVRFWPMLILAARYKVVFLQRTSFPFRLERLLKRINQNIVFDLDDAIFISDTQGAGLINRLKQYCKSTEAANILRVSKCAIVENEYIKTYAQKYCPSVFLIPGPIDTTRNFYLAKPQSQELTIGWIGSPSTSIYLNILDRVLRQISSRYKVQIKLIGAGRYHLDTVRIVNVDWCLDQEVAELQSFDIGVMPMPDDRWTRGKLGCKMLQYMSVGVPAVVSYTPTNAEAIENGVNGFLVRSEREWVEKLSLLIENSELRRKIGLAGRRTAEEKFSLEVNAPRIKQILSDICATGGED